MRPFFVIRQIFANAVDHHHNECAIIHIQPVGTADELIGAVSGEGTVNIFAKVGLVKPRHDVGFLRPGCFANRTLASERGSKNS